MTPSERLDPRTVQCWLGALQQLALSDGDFDALEQQLLDQHLADLMDGEEVDWSAIDPPSDDSLRQAFGDDSGLADQFLRTAVLTALADGHLSVEEMELLQRWADLLGLGRERLQGLHPDELGHRPLDEIREWLDELEPSDPRVAAFIVSLIPSQCPFERDIVLFGHKIVHIPPMCKLNPLYEQLVGLRFRCLNSLPEQQQLKIAERDAARAQT